MRGLFEYLRESFRLEEGQSERSAIMNQLKRLLIHMLKCKYQNGYENKSSWRGSIIDAESSLLNCFIDVGKGALYNVFYMRNMPFDRIYRDAVRKASFETHLPESVFPKKCEWTKEELTDEFFIDRFIEEYGWGSAEERKV